MPFDADFVQKLDDSGTAVCNGGTFVLLSRVGDCRIIDEVSPLVLDGDVPAQDATTSSEVPPSFGRENGRTQES